MWATENKDRSKWSDKMGRDFNRLVALWGSPCSVVTTTGHYVTQHCRQFKLQSLQIELLGWPQLVALVGPGGGKTRATNAVWSYSRQNTRKNLDTVPIPTILPAGFFLIGQGIQYIIAKSISKVINFLTFSVQAQNYKKKYAVRKTLSNEHCAYKHFPPWQKETTESRSSSILRILSSCSHVKWG